MSKRIVFVTNVDWAFISHRLPLGLHSIKEGYEVYLLAKDTGKKKLLKSFGIKLIDINFDRSSTNLFREFLTFTELYRKIGKLNPDILHNVGQKPVMHGSLVGRIQRIPKIVNAIIGMGYLFTSAKGIKKKLIAKIVESTYSIIISGKRIHLIVQNQTDYDYFRNKNVKNVNLILGSGVDTNHFKQITEPTHSKNKVALIGRMLWDKGIGEYVEAIKLLPNTLREQTDFYLVGMEDKDNLMAIDKSQLEEWNTDGVQWVGHQDDVKSWIENSNIIVLPSYREGLPKVLIEALSCGRAIITTDVPGCREVVIHEENGLLVPVKNSGELSKALLKLLSDKEYRARVAINNRKRAIDFFDEAIVVEKTFTIYDN